MVQISEDLPLYMFNLIRLTKSSAQYTQKYCGFPLSVTIKMPANLFPIALGAKNPYKCQCRALLPRKKYYESQCQCC